MTTQPKSSMPCAPIWTAFEPPSRPLLHSTLAALLIVAIAGSAEARQWYNLNIIVRNAVTNAPIPGALVEIDQDFGNGSYRYTDGGGFSNFGVTAATIYYQASSAGFASASGNVTISDHHTAYLWLTPQVSATQPYTFVVNGTGDSNPSWIQASHPFMIGIQNTYGVPPIRVIWTSNGVCDVSECSGYSGIWSGAYQFADRVHQFNVPSTSQLNFIGFSHGANVAHAANRWLISRVADHFVQIAMPHNYDIRDLAQGIRVYPRHCSVFSWTDNIVMLGSSPGQQAAHWAQNVLSSYWANEAHEANMVGNWADAQWYTQISQWYAALAWEWWMTARWDPLAHWNFPAGNFAHTDMHYDWMFTGLPAECKTN
jgi:hypothetical protein